MGGVTNDWDYELSSISGGVQQKVLERREAALRSRSGGVQQSVS